MSIRGLTAGCPACGDTGPFFLDTHGDCGVFARGYRCGVCAAYWYARPEDMADHPSEYEASEAKPCTCEPVEGAWNEPLPPQLHIVRPPIEFQIETRPSVGTGFSWWAVLRYGRHEFIDLLPHDFPALDEGKRDELVEESARKLKAQLAPILRAEDGE